MEMPFVAAIPVRLQSTAKIARQPAKPMALAGPLTISPAHAPLVMLILLMAKPLFCPKKPIVIKLSSSRGKMLAVMSSVLFAKCLLLPNRLNHVSMSICAFSLFVSQLMLLTHFAYLLFSLTSPHAVPRA